MDSDKKPHAARETDYSQSNAADRAKKIFLASKKKETADNNSGNEGGGLPKRTEAERLKFE